MENKQQEIQNQEKQEGLALFTADDVYEELGTPAGPVLSLSLSPSPLVVPGAMRSSEQIEFLGEQQQQFHGVGTFGTQTGQGIPPNQPLLQTPGVGHGDWYSDYAKGFDQHQKMLQLQASASQAGHGIPMNQQSLYTPGVVYGAAPISISSTYAGGFDQHQKMLQLQASATQAGHGIPPNQSSWYAPLAKYGAWHSGYAKGFDQDQQMLLLQASATEAGHGIPSNQPSLQTLGFGHETGRAYAGEFPQGSVTKEDIEKKIQHLIKKGYIQLADDFVDKVKWKYYHCMLCPEDENKMRKQFGGRRPVINHFETYDDEHKKCM